MGDITSNLVMHWKLQNNADDETVNNNDGTEVGSPSYEAGVDGNGILVESGKGVTGPYSVGIDSSFSISLWIKMKALANNGNIFGGDGGSGYWGDLHIGSDGTITFEFDDGQGGVANNFVGGNDQVSVDQWAHLVIASDGSTDNDMYVDGVQVETGVDMGFVTPGGSTDPHDIVHNGDNCVLDEIRIYERKLASADVTDLYNLDKPADVNKGAGFFQMMH